MDTFSRNAARRLHRREKRLAAAGALCALAAASCALYLMWNSNRPVEPVGDQAGQVARPDSPPAAPPVPQRAPVVAPPQVTAPSPAPAGGIYRCREGTRVVYTDHPCGADSTPLDLAPPSAGLRPDRSYAEQLARVRAERAQHAASLPVAQASRTPAPDERQRCAAIDAGIRQIDAITRQPLTVPMAEHYRERRRALMDERFSIGCNG
jgi:hypothetical protein